MERKYSVKEIDAMRKDVFTLLLHPGLESQPAPDDHLVEDRLRTYLVAGVSPEDLAAEAEAHRANMPEGGTYWVEGPILKGDHGGGWARAAVMAGKAEGGTGGVSDPQEI